MRYAVLLLEDTRVKFRVLDHCFETIVRRIVAIPKSFNAFLEHVERCLGQTYLEFVLRYLLVGPVQSLSLRGGPTLGLVLPRRGR